MKTIKFTIIIPLLVFFLLGAAFFPGNNELSAQISKTSYVKSYRVAAEQNKRLQYSLRWTFGRKTQRGWYLYVPLIQHTLKTEAKADSAEFASAISKWQKSKRIRANGILNRQTLYSFIKYWQSKRIKPIRVAREHQLLTANISNFYDPTRDIDLLKVEKETFRAYQKMVRAAINEKGLGLEANERGRLKASEQFLKLVSTYRSPAYQASLRKKEPGASRAQIAFRSPHFTGRALDIYVGGKPVTTKDFNRAIQIKTPVYKWLVKNAERFGFFPYFYEPWHWEYIPQNKLAK